MFGSCCHIKHVDARGCAIIPNKADNNPKAEPTRLRRSGRILVPSEGNCHFLLYIYAQTAHNHMAEDTLHVPPLVPCTAGIKMATRTD